MKYSDVQNTAYMAYVDTTPLDRLAAVAEELGADRLASGARALAERTAEGRFFVACVGQVKRGKSTLINALAGALVLPCGVVPVTAVTTVVRYGAELGARVRVRRGDWQVIAVDDVARYVSEERNPENASQVEAIEVFVPSRLLATGMCLVDTPGVGSIFLGNTAATAAFLPRIDACILVIGADPPLSGDELALAETVSKHGADLIVVLNKADRVSAEERREAVAFASHALAARMRQARRRTDPDFVG